MVGRHFRWTSAAALLVAGVVLAAGCSGGSSEPSTTTSGPATTTTTTTSTSQAPDPPDPPTTTATTTTTIVPATTTSDPLARPEVLVSNFDRDSIDDFDTTGDDLYRITLELMDLFNYLETHPTGTGEEMVGLMMEPSYQYWDSIVESFDELAANPGWHYTDPGIEILGIDVHEVSGDLATVSIADRRGQQVVTDAKGNVVKTYPGWIGGVNVYTLRKGADGHRRFLDLEPFQPISEELLVEMVAVEWNGRPQ